MPWQCEYCRHKFCLEHAKASAHECPAEAEALLRRKAENAARHVGAASAAAHVGPTDARTLKQLAIQKRQQEERALAAPREAQKSRQASALAKFRQWANDKAKAATAGTAAPVPAAAAAAATTPPKRLDPTVAPLNAVSVSVRVSERPRAAPARFTVPKAWSVGRLLDRLARELDVENMNARQIDAAQRLSLLLLPRARSTKAGPHAGPMTLEPSQSVGKLVQNGDSLMLHRGGPLAEKSR